MSRRRHNNTGSRGPRPQVRVEWCVARTVHGFVIHRGVFICQAPDSYKKRIDKNIDNEYFCATIEVRIGEHVREITD